MKVIELTRILNLTVAYCFGTALVIFSTPAFSTGPDCSVILDSNAVVSLPSELRINDRILEVARQNPEDYKLLVSLTRIFGQLDDAGLLKLARQLHDLELPEVVEAFSADDRDVVRVLLNPKKFPAKATQVALDDDTVTMFIETLKREENQILSRAEYREAMATTLDQPELRSEFVKVAIRNGQNVDPDIFDSTSERLRSGRPLTKHQRMAATFGLILVPINSLALFERHQQKINDHSELYDLVNKKIIARREAVLAFAEHFFAEEFRLKSSVTEVTDLVDLLYFNTPLPMRPALLYTELIDQAKKALLPLKNRASQLTVTAVPNTKTSVTPLQYQPKDFFEPNKSVSFGRKSESKVDTPAIEAKRIEESISRESSLREFTDFAEKPRQIGELKAETVYEFWFLRDNQATLQKVAFSTAAVRWLNSNPQLGRAYLNALHLGRARSEGQQGLKEMVGTSNRYDGKIYSLKVISQSGFRGLTLGVNGVWQIIDFVAKDDVVRAMPFLAPLDL